MKKKMITTVMILALLLSACTPVKEEATDGDVDSIQAENSVDGETKEKGYSDGEIREKGDKDGGGREKGDKERNE